MKLFQRRRTTANGEFLRSSVTKNIRSINSKQLQKRIPWKAQKKIIEKGSWIINYNYKKRGEYLIINYKRREYLQIDEI